MLKLLLPLEHLTSKKDTGFYLHLKVKWLELQVVIDGHLLRNNRPMAAPIRAGFPTRAVADKGKALTTDPQHPTERGLPLVQLSVKIRRSKKELSYVVFCFLVRHLYESYCLVV